jgi:xanthine dehydrogenase molybdenum-binding subunit
VPHIESLIVEVASGDGPYGSKVVGETPMVSPVAAIANAVADALGVRIFDLPITPERVWKAMKE